jgi:hypothetical protein
MSAVQDLPVGATHAEVERLDEQLTVGRAWVGKLGQLGALGLAGDDGDRAHA